MRRPLRSLRRDERGVALIEMALSMPIVLLLGLGGLELANYSLAVLKANQIAYAVADNAGRVRHALDETDVNEIMIGAKLMGGSNFAANSRIILSDLEKRTTASGGVYRQWIRWQRCAGALNSPSSYGGPLTSSGGPVTDLDNTTNIDHGAVETTFTMDGMGPTGQQIASSGGTAVMVVEIFYAYRPLVPLYAYGASTIHVFEAFNIRQRSDFSVYNAGKLKGNSRSDCRYFNSAIPS